LGQRVAALNAIACFNLVAATLVAASYLFHSLLNVCKFLSDCLRSRSTNIGAYRHYSDFNKATTAIRDKSISPGEGFRFISLS